MKAIAIIGPTASGKTRRAVSAAREFDGEIISADSRQVYKDMSIGTGKDLEEYGEVPYHLIDICEAGEKYNLHRFLNDFHNTYDDVIARGKLPVICGGSGMYVENALNGISMPEVPANFELRKDLENKSLEQLTSILRNYKTLHNTTDVDTIKRAVRAIEIAEFYRLHPDKAALASKENAVPIPAIVIGMDISREDRRKSISARLKSRLEAGMLEEVRALLDKGLTPDDLIYYGLEYKYLTLHLIGQISYKEMLSGLEIAIHQFAKRQMTWFRGMEKRGIHVNWLPYDMPDREFIDYLNSLMF